MQNKPIDIAVVVGYHSYKTREFQDFFQSLPGIRCYIQHLEQFTSSSRETRQSYDCVLFYIYRQDTPVDEGPWYEGKALTALSELGETPQGIMMLHHSLLAFPGWPVWRDICGLSPDTYESYALDRALDFSVTGEAHPVTEGLGSFRLVDEAYAMGPSDPGTKVLVRCETPGNISTAVWTNTYRRANVLCCQPGHGPAAWGEPAFRQIVLRGLLWLAGGSD